ncbi:hypothetical protein BD626DRAFT_107320 [Schizophyllum amplum]|uniref:Fork-head domain-containing protein n=1 Tax=Schizophyllum amplum TaxID=97359 RepID=A0A550CSV8_9AGAR|nr:hypothetical protein BD626DRAFT_107320 [Auriculariopsis ampla]
MTAHDCCGNSQSNLSIFGETQTLSSRVRFAQSYASSSAGLSRAVRFATSTSAFLCDPVTDPSLDALNERYLRERVMSRGKGSIDLWALPDYSPDKKPRVELVLLVMLALHGSPTRALRLQEIYAAIISRYPYFKKAHLSRQRSICPILSRKRQFRYFYQPMDAHGSECLWYLDLSHEEETSNRKWKPATTSRVDLQCIDGNCISQAWVLI